MKFSDLAENEWENLKPYMDTCLLPLTGLTGRESPGETTLALEGLRDRMDLVEIPFRGRVVTYPALHYFSEQDAFVNHVNELCRRLKATQFTYVVLITGKLILEPMRFTESDLFLNLSNSGSKQQVADQMNALWKAVESPETNVTIE